jgi:HAMP domain-containing protein
MKKLINPEVRRELVLYLLLTAIFSVTGFSFAPVSGVIALILGLCLSLCHLFFAIKRYNRIEWLSRSIDELLHGQAEVLITEQKEGELSILESEVRKMTLRLKEQADELRDDKLRLTAAIEDIFHQLRTPLTAMKSPLPPVRRKHHPGAADTAHPRAEATA